MELKSIIVRIKDSLESFYKDLSRQKEILVNLNIEKLVFPNLRIRKKKE